MLTSIAVVQLLSNQFSVDNIRLAPALVSYYTNILRSLSFNSRAEKTRSFLSSSPVKMLSNFLGSNSPDITSQSPPKQHRGMLSPPPLITRASQASRESLVAASKESLVDSIRSRASRDTIPGPDEERPDNPLVRLEQTFTGYVACLQSRRGHFIGPLLLNRAGVDELSVNDLYNRLMESPYDLEASADVTSETIFVAFEKFVHIAWQEQMGSVMSTKHLDLLLERAGRRVPGEFGDFVRYLFNEMAPQNRRAFTALIKLLASLLEGCNNDSDRGALTVAFAQLLVDDGSAHNYINLLDRLVEDCERIFEDPLAALASSFERSAAYESMNSTVRSHKSANGSMTSNTSSLRRKWGFENLLRQNSKNEGDRPSVWRSLSKRERNAVKDEHSSLSRAGVSRSKSIDVGVPNTMPNKLRRPGSRDRPRVAGVFDDLAARPQSVHRPGSSYRLETIGEPEIEVIEPTRPTLKKKRRSSLSDLKNLMGNVTLEDKDDGNAGNDGEADNADNADNNGSNDNNGNDAKASPLPSTDPPQPRKSSPPPKKLSPPPKKLSPPPNKLSPPPNKPSPPPKNSSPPPKKPSPPPKDITPPPTAKPPVLDANSPLPLNISKQTSEKFNSSPRVPVPSKIPKGSLNTSPKSTTSPPQSSSKIPMTPQSQSMRSPRPRINNTLGEPFQSMFSTPQPPTPTGTIRRRHAKTLSTSNIPSLKPSRLPMAGAFTPMSLEFSKSAIRSPTQKLKLQSPQKLRERLQTEKKAVEDVDSNLKSELSRISEDMARVNSTMPRSNTQDLRKLSASVKALEERIPQVLQELDERQRAIQEDMDSSLRASEGKVKAIDQLYKEATAENELLYEKFNTELGRILKAIRGKGREDREELASKLKDQSEETAYVKKENARLRREIVSLRALLKGSGPNLNDD